ncbi:MAG: hypothetical protein D6729_17975 [Deltaproteobacteria bacterium]|nr:MAG: hypothetical protein D6729_17975 [Deltaproteobacteria bacterium]
MPAGLVQIPRARGSELARDEASGELHRCLEASRLVTVLGPAGAGKTHLVRALGRQLQEQGRSVYWVDLTEARGWADVAAAFAGVLSTRLTEGESETRVAGQLAAALGVEEAVLLVDNCEHLVPVLGGFLGALLDAAGGVRIVATSRIALEITGERRYPLPLLRMDEAVRLFRMRAEELGRTLPDDEDTQRRIERIVRRLDRLPLAIELAAGRVEILPLEEIEKRLEADLAASSILAEAIGASWELLTAVERRVLAWSSVFRGGFDLEAAEAVLAEPAGGAQVVDVLQALHRKSLLRATFSGGSAAGVRYGLLEAVRAFALGRLEALGEARAATAAHAEYYARLDAPDALSAEIADVARDADNVLHVARCAAQVAPAAAARAALAADILLAARGPADLRLSNLEGAIRAADASGDAVLQARTRVQMAIALRARGRWDETEALLDEAEALARGVAAHAAAGRAMLARALLEGHRGRHEQALAICEAALAEVGEPRFSTFVHSVMGNILVEINRAHEAEAHYREALRLEREHGDHRAEAFTTADLGLALLDAGRREEARATLERALELHRAREDARTEGILIGWLGMLELDCGRPAEGRRLLRTAVERHRTFAESRFLDVSLGYLAVAHHLSADPKEAAVLYEEALRGLMRTGDVTNRCVFLAFRAQLDVEGGRLHEAQAAIAEIDRLLRDEAVRPFLLALRRVAEATLHHARGEEAAAQRTVEEVRRESEMRPSFDVRRALELFGRVARQAGAECLRVEATGRWFQVAGQARVDLSRRGAMRRILVELTRRHRDTEAASVNELLEVGWPGERVHPEAGANRVYAAIRTLRRLGLEEILITVDRGYALCPEVSVEVV